MSNIATQEKAALARALGRYIGGEIGRRLGAALGADLGEHLAVEFLAGDGVPKVTEVSAVLNQETVTDVVEGRCPPKGG